MLDCPIDIVYDIIHLKFLKVFFFNTGQMSEAREKVLLQEVVYSIYQIKCTWRTFNCVLNAFKSGACIIIRPQYKVFFLSWQTCCEARISRIWNRELKLATTKTK